jgi:hypothetical protein
MAKNISKVYLLNVPLEDDMRNTLYFANASDQHTYFQNNISKTYNNVSYQSETRTFRCPDQIDTVRQYNYIMWQNTAYSNKWFYAFIKKMTYVSDGYTDVVFEVDPLQTFMFDIEVKPSFIEREHTNNDTIGANTLPEGLELGDMVCNGDVSNFGVNIAGVGDWVIVVDVSMIANPGDGQTLKYTGDPPAQYVNSTPSGLYHLVLGVNQSVIIGANTITDLYNEAGLGDAIQNVYILPRDLIGNVTAITLSTMGSAPQPYRSVGVYMPNSSTGVTNLGTFTKGRVNNIRGYIPRNKKLLCWPFNYINVSNNAGSTIPYRYEDFSGDIAFKVEGVMTPSGSIKAVPQNYKYITSNENAYDYSITSAKYPICAWTTDAYTNWLTQNGVNMAMQWQKEAIGSAVDIIGGGIRGALAGAAAGGIGAIPGAIAGAGIGAIGAGASLIGVAKEQFQAKTQANMVADQSRGNANAGDIVWSKHKSQFTFIPMSIKAEYARCIDDYFDAFGYQVNRMKVPNTNHRQNWWYTKTMNANIVGNVPNEEMNKIKSAYNNGLTFWRNPSNFLNYSVSNGIV